MNAIRGSGATEGTLWVVRWKCSGGTPEGSAEGVTEVGRRSPPDAHSPCEELKDSVLLHISKITQPLPISGAGKSPYTACEIRGCRKAAEGPLPSSEGR